MMKSVADTPFMGLLALKITSINLQDKQVFEYLIQILNKNKLLTDLNLESSGLLPC